MNRAQLQQLAEERIRDAATLLNGGRWSGAYYLAGYAVECGLKACVAKLVQQHDFPDKDLAVKCYTHKVETLLLVAGLKALRDADVAANLTRRTNWLIVKDWDEASRYRLSSEFEARQLVAAITDSTNGVLSWIMGHW